MVTSSRLWLNNELYPQKTSVATLYQVLPRQRLDWFTIIPSPRMFVECLYCDVSPPPILPVLSRFIEFACHMQLYSRTVIYSLYSHTNHIRSYKSRSFIQLYIHTLILSHIYACTTYTYMVASVTQSLVWSYPFVSVFKSFQAASPKKNGPLEFTLLILLQVVSPKQRTT